MEVFPSHILQRLEATQVVAGFAVDKVEHAVPICKALLAGGMDAVEMMLRTPVVLDALKVVCKEVPEMLVGVGTILTPEAVVDVKEAGVDFGVSPGMNPRVIMKAQEIGLPFAPGICTPSDLEQAIELGCRLVKFFPAEPMGGAAYLKSMGAPYKHLGIKYFPLGGLKSTNMMSYLQEPNVPCIGGSWIVRKDLVENEDWDGITASAKEVLEMVKKAGK